ncbi:MAG: hypothetical protein HQK72_05015 [Desulfamplus sp.]|nr:hypothetical protein [Desulfamplus sp.]
MRSRRNDDFSSFELLLDTMCNTFGGIVFIALLLTLLAQSIEIKSDSKDLNSNKIEQINNKNSNDSNPIQQIHQIKEKIQTNTEIIALSKENIKALEQEIEVLNQEILNSEKIKNQERELRLPKLHKIDKSPVFIAIRYGKFYAITNVSHSITNISSEKWGNSGRGYDSSEIFINEYNNITNIELLSGRGQIIKKGAEKSGKLQQALLNINNQKEFINFAVFPDSFSEFNYVKELFINRGFDYNWFIIKKQLSLVKGVGQIHVQ